MTYVNSCPACLRPVYWSEIKRAWMHSDPADDRTCPRGDKP